MPKQPYGPVEFNCITLCLSWTSSSEFDYPFYNTLLILNLPVLGLTFWSVEITHSMFYLDRQKSINGANRNARSFQFFSVFCENMNIILILQLELSKYIYADLFLYVL